MTDFICKKCGSTEYEIKDKPNGTGIAHGLYCAKCGFWHKWLSKEELRQYATKESKDEIIAKLQSENAELKSSLTHANEECLKWHERAQNLLKDSGGSISGYEKKISALQAENAALRERLEKAEVEKGKLKPFIKQDDEGCYRVYRAEYILQYIIDSICRTPEAAEACLAELKEKKE